MAQNAPASAALLAQSQFLGPDLAPLLAPPTRESSVDPALVAASQDLAGVTSKEVVPADKLIETGVRYSWKEIAVGTDGSWRREVSYWVAGFVVATVVRSVCFQN